MKRIVTFGEVMGRFCPPGFKRFRQSMPGEMGLTFAGAEANVAASISLLGGSSRFVTALPKHDIANACIASLNTVGIDTSCIVQSEAGRLGLYFLETGANQRPSRVIYDRGYSSVSMTPTSEYNWTEAFKDAAWLHTTGITPALSKRRGSDSCFFKRSKITRSSNVTRS